MKKIKTRHALLAITILATASLILYTSLGRKYNSKYAVGVTKGINSGPYGSEYIRYSFKTADGRTIEHKHSLGGSSITPPFIKNGGFYLVVYDVSLPENSRILLDQPLDSMERNKNWHEVPVEPSDISWE